MHTYTTTFVLLVTTALPACAEDLGDALADGSSDGDGGSDDGQIENTAQGELVRTVVDATDAMRWVWFDLETRSQVDPADPLHSEDWDLGFSRYNIALNGGVSGEAGMDAAVLEDTMLESVTAVPDGPWITDAPDSDDHGDDPDYALADWYDYDFATHVLTARPTVYVVRSVEGNAFALEVLDYYDDAGSSGWLQLRWKPLAQ
jgi:HmuY protein